jgi:hypothetical protein
VTNTRKKYSYEGSTISLDLIKFAQIKDDNKNSMPRMEDARVI